MIRELRVPLAWHWIERVRDAVNEVLHDHPSELRESAVMVASELAENLVKYGHPVDGEDSGRIAIELGAHTVSITAENGTTREEAAKVVELIDTINAASDVQLLYVQRLTEMAHSPSESASELGLLRIVFEGRFRLTCRYAHPMLRIEATRSADA